MPEDITIEDLVSRPESPSSLVRFEDDTDVNAPRLSYAVPLPGAFSGKLYIETDFFNDELPWLDAAREDRRVSPAIEDLAARIASGEDPALPPVEAIAVVPTAAAMRRDPATVAAIRSDEFAPVFVASLGHAAGAPLDPSLASRAITSMDEFVSPGESPHVNLAVRFDELVTSFDQIAAEARAGRAPVFYRTFGGAPQLTFVEEAASPREANPRFVIIEHYRLSSHFGDYGAGKTTGVFSLMPGEETTLYIRNWRRNETTLKMASSIFDSFTEEAATEFETDLLTETTDTSNYSVNRKMHSKYSGSGEINLGLFKTKHSGEASDALETQSARESVSKNVAKVTASHSSKASSKRETEVTQELETTAAQELETITARTIKNPNVSRTLNIVSRELNQEFTTYLSLVDVSFAFVNDLNVFEVFQVHELDRMLAKYLPAPPTEPGFTTPSLFGSVSEYTFVRQRLIEQVNGVYDFQGTRHDFLEEVSLADNEQVFGVGQAPAGIETYLRVRRARHADQPNPFYEPGFVPVEGVVMSETTNTVRTPAILIDALLSFGIALDNYNLGKQREELRREHNENRKVELALSLIESGDEAALEAYRSLFGSVDINLLRAVAGVDE
jgi:hypothetical protein